MRRRSQAAALCSTHERRHGPARDVSFMAGAGGGNVRISSIQVHDDARPASSHGGTLAPTGLFPRFQGEPPAVAPGKQVVIVALEPQVTARMKPLCPAPTKAGTRWAVVRRILLAQGRATAWLEFHAARPQL